MICYLLGAVVGTIIGLLINKYITFPLLDWLTGNKD
jgi:hypothetical protein